MRRASNGDWLMEGDVLVGINLGSDFCAEHEWGIEDLKSTLGVVCEGYGIERRRARKPDKNCIALKTEGDTLNLIVQRKFSLKYTLENSLDKNSEWKFYDNKNQMTTAWNENGFIVRVRGEENFKKLQKIHEELLKGNVAIWLGGGGVFQNAGLCLAIVDNVSAENKKTMFDGDTSKENLKKAAEETGIKSKIDAANKEYKRSYDSPWGYFALSPSWANEDRKEKTKYPVIFWLNPMHQDTNNSGWFTVEELEQWLDGKGPVIKKKKGRKS